MQTKTRGLRAAFFRLTSALIATLLFAGGEVVFATTLAEQNNATITTKDLRATFPPTSPGATEPRNFSDRSQASRVLSTVLAIRQAARDDGKALSLTELERSHLVYLREKLSLDFALELIEQRVRAEYKTPNQLTTKRIREIYDTVTDGFKVPETAEVAHILLRIGTGALSERAALADEIARKARGGEDWATLVQTYSEDQGSLGKQGYVGRFMFAPGTDHPMVQAAFRTKVEKDIADPVISRSGIHVVRIVKREAARRATFDEAQPQILDQIVREAVLFQQNKYLAALNGGKSIVYNEAEIEKLTVKDDPAAQKRLDSFYDGMKINTMDAKPKK